MTTGILLIHGFAGTRNEIAPLKKHLEKCGFIVSVPTLAGHELTKKDLAKSKYKDWIKSAEDAAKELKKSCDKLIIMGFSMGGLVAVNLCQNIETEKLVLINTPIYYWDVVRISKNLTADFKTYFKKYFIDGASIPFKALLNFQKLLSKTKQLFVNINCPVFIIQTLDDDAVNPKSSDYIFRNIKSEKLLKKYDIGGHKVFESSAGNHVCMDINKFM